jgi:predicted transcriptional regulator
MVCLSGISGLQAGEDVKVSIRIMTKAVRKGVISMPQLTIEIPDALAQRLARLASEQKKSVEQVAVEQLESVLEPAAENLAEKYARFFQQSGLFVEPLAEEKQRYQAVSAARLKELAAKLGAAGPLSEVIIAERDRH